MESAQQTGRDRQPDRNTIDGWRSVPSRPGLDPPESGAGTSLNTADGRSVHHRTFGSKGRWCR